MSKSFRYVALGDSYTICEGALPGERWPVILAKHLSDSGIPVVLIANPSHTGWTTADLIEKELPVLDKSGADFVTLCIGVNDWVQGVDSEEFEKNLIYIIERIRLKLSNKKNLILLSIPDFSVSPNGPRYGGGRDITGGISSFNDIINKTASKYGIQVVDLFEASKEMKKDPSLVAGDGLHPSAKEYAIWETLIFPVAKKLLNL